MQISIIFLKNYINIPLFLKICSKMVVIFLSLKYNHAMEIETTYKINEYTYNDAKNNQQIILYARTDEVAEELKKLIEKINNVKLTHHLSFKRVVGVKKEPEIIEKERREKILLDKKAK